MIVDITASAGEERAPEQLPALLPAAQDLANVLATLRQPDMSGLWQYGGMPLDLAYTALQRALAYERQAPGLFRRYTDAIMANAQIGLMNANLQADLLEAQELIRQLRAQLEQRPSP